VSTEQRTPVHFDQLLDELAELGLPEGGAILVHCSLRQIGFVPGGAGTLLRAIQRLIGPGGTVVVPTHTADNSTTSHYHLAAVRGMTAWQRRRYVARMPGFDRDTSPSYHTGLFAEHVRCDPDSVRSGHPQTSFAALGPAAGSLMADHRLTSHLGEHSPLAALYAAGGHTLLLGVGYDRCTALHLAEYRLPADVDVSMKTYQCFVVQDGRRKRLVFEAIDLNSSSFGHLGADLDRAAFVRSGRVGHARARLIPIREAVDFAVGWLAARRRRSNG
jgi:aminoglycoside 3-N-acetyltransferase